MRLFWRSTDLDSTDLGNVVCSLIFNTLSSDCCVYFNSLQHIFVGLS